MLPRSSPGYATVILYVISLNRHNSGILWLNDVLLFAKPKAATVIYTNQGSYSIGQYYSVTFVDYFCRIISDHYCYLAIRHALP